MDLIIIWLFFGVLAEVIGCFFDGEFNGYKNTIIIIIMGFLSFIGIIFEICDEIYE